jgi:hypothetical protein
LEVFSKTRECFEKELPFAHIERVRHVDGYAHVHGINFTPDVRLDSQNVGAGRHTNSKPTYEYVFCVIYRSRSY